MELLATLVKIVILWILKLMATITLRSDGKTIVSVYLGKNNVTPATMLREKGARLQGADGGSKSCN